MSTFITYLVLTVLVVVNANVPPFQQVCQKEVRDSGKLVLHFDEWTATVNVTLLNRLDSIFYKLHLFADWGPQTDELICNNHAHLLPHTEISISPETVRIDCATC